MESEVEGALRAGQKIVVISLKDTDDNPIIDGMKTHEVNNTDTDIKGLRDIEFDSSHIRYEYVTDNSIKIKDLIKVPYSVNPNMFKVEKINIYLSVKSLESNLPTFALFSQVFFFRHHFPFNLVSPKGLNTYLGFR